MKINFTFPWIPEGANTELSSHWSARQRDNKEIDKDIGWLLRIAFKKPIPEDWGKIKISCLGYNNKLDYDNFVFSCKHIIDSICSYLKIINDSRSYVKRHYDETLKDEGLKRIEIIIEKIGKL